MRNAPPQPLPSERRKGRAVQSLGPAPVLRASAQAQQALPLWSQLQAVAQVVAQVRAGSSGTAALAAVAPALRPGVQALAFHVWRNWGRAIGLRQQLAHRPPAPAVDALLCVALALAWQTEAAPYDAFTLVNQTVEAAKRSPDTRHQAAFMNACLRRFLREHDSLVARTTQDPLARWNHPPWWIARLQADHPDSWQDVLQAANQSAPMCLRVNLRKTTVHAYLAQLADAGIAAQACADSGIALLRPVPVERLPGFAQGMVSVQDAAAQLAAPLLLAALPTAMPLRILDACAAPGGKTAHLLERSAADVLALDVDAQRGLRITENLARLGLQARVLAADAALPNTWWDGALFDGILLDAPCTASGIVRRHPDVRWLRRATDVDQLAAVQKTLLNALWPLLKPGGSLLYCTCSVFRAEGSAQIQSFLARHTDAHLLPSPGHLIPTNGPAAVHVPDNQPTDHDGFFYALLQKQLA